MTTPFFAEEGQWCHRRLQWSGVETTEVLMVSAAEAATSFRAMVSVLVPDRPEAAEPASLFLRVSETRRPTE